MRVRITLEKIVAAKREEVETRKRAEPPLRPKRKRVNSGRFIEAIAAEGLSVIAEVKYGSPLKGRFGVSLKPSELAKAFERGGARAISVLADRRFFGGGPEVVEEVRRVTFLPLLYKDFVVDEWQVAEAAALSCDAVLLVVAALTDEELSALSDAALSLGLEPLFEVHDERELRRALRLRPKVVGINNRNLSTMEVDISNFERLAPLAPEGVFLVAESGIRTPKEARRMAEAGADAVLVGEALSTSPDPEGEVRVLLSSVREVKEG